MRHIRTFNDESIMYPVFKYMDRAYAFIQHNVEQICRCVKETKKIDIDIVVRGSSGAILGSLLYVELHKAFPTHDIRIIYVRKEGETRHGNDPVVNIESYIIIIDDFIKSGRTVRHIYDYIQTNNRCEASVGRIQVDMLVVSSTVDIRRLKFEPDIVISDKLIDSSGNIF